MTNVDDPHLKAAEYRREWLSFDEEMRRLRPRWLNRNPLHHRMPLVWATRHQQEKIEYTLRAARIARGEFDVTDSEYDPRLM